MTILVSSYKPAQPKGGSGRYSSARKSVGSPLRSVTHPFGGVPADEQDGGDLVAVEDP